MIRVQSNGVDSYLNPSSIVRISEAEGAYIATDILGMEHRICEADTGAIFFAMDDRLVPAEPGTYWLLPTQEEDGLFYLQRMKVLAWRLAGGRSVEPVVLHTRATFHSDGYYILMPDGRVETDDGLSWSSFDAWKAGQNLVGEMPDGEFYPGENA